MKKVILYLVPLLLIATAGLFLLRGTNKPPSLIFQGYSLDDSGNKVARIALTNTFEVPIRYMSRQANDSSSLGYVIKSQRMSEAAITNTFTQSMYSDELLPHQQVVFSVVLPTNNPSSLQVETVYVPEEGIITKFVSYFGRKLGWKKSMPIVSTSAAVELP